jgi:hypothetical protein
MEINGHVYAPAALSPGTELPVPNEEEAGWATEPVQTLWKSEKSLGPSRNRTPIPRAANR